MNSNEKKTSRLCVLLSPASREALDDLCAKLDTTASQVVRRLLRNFLASGGRFPDEALHSRRRRHGSRGPAS
jgi:hypothetical protein